MLAAIVRQKFARPDAEAIWCGSRPDRKIWFSGMKKQGIAMPITKRGHTSWSKIGVWALFAFHMVVLPLGATWAIGLERNATIPYALGMLLFVLGVSVFPVASRFTDWLGRISYSVYLFHPVVFQASVWLLLQQPAASWWRSWHLGIYLLVDIGLTLVLADVVYRWVERPGIAMGHRLAAAWAARRRRTRATLPPAAGIASSID